MDRKKETRKATRRENTTYKGRKIIVREMTERGEGAAAPKQRQGHNEQQNQQQQQQQQNQDAAGQRHIHINLSNFKPEFSGKPEEDVEAHLLCSNDWMHAHHFNEDIKVQRFCLTLLGRQDCGSNL